MLEPEDKWDWIEFVARAAGALGLNSVRVRWKLMAWRESFHSAKHQTRATVEHINYQHKICPSCGSVQDRGNRICSNCGKALSPRFWEILRRIGIVAPHFNSVSSLLTAVIVVAYIRTALAPNSGFFMMGAEALILHGANIPQLVQAGEWWRLSTYIFLHAGMMHIVFNLIALQQIGPQIEEVFGKGRMLFVFMVTGILAGWGSDLVRMGGIGIGASGSLMGLIGFAAGWGHRDGTSTGRQIRDFMVKWGVYTVVFGFMIHADNGAHIAGFVGGFLLGLVSKPQWERRGPALADHLMTLVGVILAVGTVYLVFFPPASHLLD